MKVSQLFYFTLILVLIISCKKEGCTDKKAKNYSVEANDNDGTCSYPKFIRIKGVEFTVIKPEYLGNWNPDCQITINGLYTQYTSEIINNVELDKTVIVNIEPNILVPLGEDGGSFDIIIEAEDGTFSYIADYPSYQFNGYYKSTFPDGSMITDQYPSSTYLFNRIEFLDPNEGLIRVTLIVDWE